MTKVRIKEISSKYYENGIEYAKKEYIIQYRQYFIWWDYEFETCENGDIIHNEYDKRFCNIDEAVEVAYKIKNLYRGKYKGYYIREMYNGVFICLNFGFEKYEYALTHYYTYKSLQEIKDYIDTLISKKKFKHINI